MPSAETEAARAVFVASATKDLQQLCKELYVATDGPTVVRTLHEALVKAGVDPSQAQLPSAVSNPVPPPAPATGIDPTQAQLPSAVSNPVPAPPADPKPTATTQVDPKAMELDADVWEKLCLRKETAENAQKDLMAKLGSIQDRLCAIGSELHATVNRAVPAKTVSNPKTGGAKGYVTVEVGGRSVRLARK